MLGASVTQGIYCLVLLPLLHVKNKEKFRGTAYRDAVILE